MRTRRRRPRAWALKLALVTGAALPLACSSSNPNEPADDGGDASASGFASTDGAGAARVSDSSMGSPATFGGVDASLDAKADRSPGADATDLGVEEASPDTPESGEGGRAGNDAQVAGDAHAGGGSDAAGAVVVAATPPIGWNSWNTFQCNISESLIEATADAMVSSGMQAAGFEYVNLDDCWMDGRDSNGNLQWNASKFPSGIPALASYVHGKGLKLGIYETPNTVTCVGLYGGISPSVAVGSLGHEMQDARTFASWGVDYLKYDLCEGQLSSFAVMRDALRASGRPIVYSINPGNGSGCPPTGPTTSVCGLDLPATANLWRIGFDINASWSSITGLIDQDAPLSAYAGPGHWNDPDMLEVGNGSLTADENKSHFSMWAMLAAPLLAGNDLRSMASTTTGILTNSEVIAVDQDALGAQATLVATPAAGLQVWSKPLTGSGVRAVALLNRNGGAASITVTFSQIGLGTGTATVRDLWQHSDLGTFSGSYTAASVPSHGVVVLRVAQ
jgi:alpha-galactosidase